MYKMKKIILGMLLVGSVVFGAKAQNRIDVKCSGLREDVEIYNKSIFKLQKVDMRNSYNVVDICEKSIAYALHILENHKNSLSKTYINTLYEELMYLILVAETLSEDGSIDKILEKY